ncbi:ECF transporter S component [Actinotalea sp.]|uniref:ECF transporter S component n=1 Tax=Actinotalea sp. TaxID=1872145 RepID=UPI0035640AD5
MRASSLVPVGRRSAVALLLASAAGALAFLWPLVVGAGSPLAQATLAPVVLGGVLGAVLLLLHLVLADGGLDVKAVALLGLLSAVGAVLRPLSAGTAGIELVFIVIILGARVLGPGFGFALGSTTLFTSALLTGGVGPWLPYQMLAASWVGLGAGLLPGRDRWRGAREVVLLVGYGTVAAFGYGLVMNMAFWPFQLGGGTGLSFVAGDAVADNLRRFVLYDLATSLGWDLGRAVTTATGLLLLGAPVLSALRRTGTTAHFAPARSTSTPAVG